MAIFDSTLAYPSEAPDFLLGGGEMGQLMRSFVWAETPLGPAHSWPPAMQTAVSICLNSRFPMVLWLGPELTMLYNDAWRPVLGATKHPHGLGRPGREVWPEIWDIIGAQMRSVLETGTATWSDDLLLTVDRYNYTEEAYFTYSYSPIRGANGEMCGVFSAVSETTLRVIGERRLKTLSELGALIKAKTTEDAVTLSADVLRANDADVPFALIYLLSEDAARAELAEAIRVQPGNAYTPPTVDLSKENLWPFEEVAQRQTTVIVDDLQRRFGKLPGGRWPTAPRCALVMPLQAPGRTELAGILIGGISPYRQLDDDYRRFYELVAGHIATSIANARAYQEAQRRAEMLAEIDRTKTVFFSNVSHEFRTPLTLMLGTLEEILAKPGDQVLADNRKLADVAHRNGLRLLKLVNTLLDFSRIEAGRVQANYEPTDLARLTADFTSSFRSAMEKAGLAFRVDCQALPEPVYVDQEMWEKVVLNLLSNAFKFTFEGEVGIALRLAEDGRTAQLEVWDTGTGIPQDEIPRLFERFHRVEGARGRSYEGTGIGLALVQELVRLHGGSIQVESEVGRGSLFRVSIPLGSGHLPQEHIASRPAGVSTALRAQAYVEEALRWLPDENDQSAVLLDLPPASEAADIPAAGIRPAVLLADDNADLREYLRRLLEPRYRVHAFGNGAAALAWSRKNVPDLVLSDVMMPELDGFGLLQRLRADPRTSSVPAILLSARAGEEAKLEGLGAGADDYLIKPFSARELLARVDTHIRLAAVRRQAAATVRESDLRFRRLFEANIFGVAFGDFSGRILDANNAFLHLIGYTRDDLARGEIHWDRMTPPEYREFDLRAQQELRVRGTCTPFEKEYIRKDGTRISVLLGSALLNEPFEEQDTAVVFCLDLTERKKIESQLRHTQKLESLGVLAGGVAHDFNNLLVGILGNASLALESTASSNPNRLLLQEVVRASERAADLTKQLLAYAGKGRFVVEPTDLSVLIREIATLIQASVPKNVQLRLDLQEGLPCIEADSAQLQQLVMNLIINGAESMGGQSGAVLVSTGVQQVDEYYLRSVYSGHDVAPGKYVMLEVQDTGCGMDEATIGKIFDPFFTTKFMGRGLGLAAALGIVQGHRGAIKVYSQPGKGSTFKVLFPASEQTVMENRDGALQRDLTGQGVVLVVDDEDVVRRTVKSALQRYGYSVLLAENGQDAVDLFREMHDRISAVILDMTMPVMGGEEALRHIKAIDRNVPVILSSGFNEVEAIRRFTGKGLAGFIQKPYTASSLAAKLKQIRENPKPI